MSDIELMRSTVSKLRANPKTLALRVSREHYLALADQIEWLNNAFRLEREYAKIEKGWRCFHCDAVFLDYDDALDHFGRNGDTPLCLRAHSSQPNPPATQSTDRRAD